jgi:hypothetical protein
MRVILRAGAAQGPSEQPYTWLANAGRGGAFLGRARSTFERLPAGIRDRNTADRNRLASLALYSCKPGVDELGEHFAREAVDVHDCFGGTERAAGEQSECSALFATETTFSRRHGDCVRHRRHRGKSPAG